jgi:hypothetical protein
MLKLDAALTGLLALTPLPLSAGASLHTETDSRGDSSLAYREARVIQWNDSEGLPRRLWIASRCEGRNPGFLAQMEYDQPKVRVKGHSEHLGGVSEVMHLGLSKDGADAVCGLRDGKEGREGMRFQGDHHGVHRLRYHFTPGPIPSCPRTASRSPAT